MMVPFVSILWLINSSVLRLCVTQVYSGFAWAVFNLCAGLFIWDAAPRENRTRYIALFAGLSALGLTLGSLIGGDLGPFLPQISGSYYLSIFLLSGIVKLVVVAGLFRRISEVRRVQSYKNHRTALWRFTTIYASKLVANNLRSYPSETPPRIKLILLCNASG